MDCDGLCRPDAFKALAKADVPGPADLDRDPSGSCASEANEVSIPLSWSRRDQVFLGLAGPCETEDASRAFASLILLYCTDERCSLEPGEAPAGIDTGLGSVVGMV